MDGALSGALRRHQGSLALLCAGAIVCLVVLAPLLVVLVELFHAGPASLGVLLAPRTLVLLLGSILLAAGVTLLALALGLPLGVLLARGALPGRSLLSLVHGFGLSLPPLTLALGWSAIFGRAGVLGSEASARALFSPLGLVLVLGLAFCPVVTALVALAVRNVDPALEEAALSVARPSRVAARILVPAVRPAITLAALIVFSLALAELGVPMFLRVDVYQAAVFARLGGIAPAPGEAVALVLPSLALAVGLLAAERRLGGSRSWAVLGLRGPARPALPLGALRVPIIVGCWLVALGSLAPVVALVVQSASRATLASVAQWAGDAPWNGLRAATLGATLILVVGVVIGHAAARGVRAARWLDAVTVLGFVTPACVLGVGLIALWNRPATQLVYGTAAIVVLGLVARYAVLGVRVLAAVVTQISPRLEEAAVVAGALYARRLFGIVLPLGARGTLFAWLLALVFCLRDLETAVLFYPPGGEPLTVRIFTLEANGPEGVVAGLCVLHAAITATVLAAGLLLMARRAR